MNASERAGAADVERWRRDPSVLPSLPLGSFDEAPVTEVALRRLLLGARVPPRLVRPLRKRSSVRRAIESYSYGRGVRSVVDRDTWRRLTQGPTILMYHAFAVGDESASRFVVPRREFERQMRWVARRRPVLRLDDLVAHRRAHRLPPAGAVIVTIDDGYEDMLSQAHPVLQEAGVPATLFVVTQRMGAPNEWEREGPLARRPLLSRDAAVALHRSGVTLGGHSRTHPILRDLPPDELDSEVAGSYADLAAAVGEPVTAFAYPFGRWSQATADAVRRAGFDCAVTVTGGRNSAATPLYGLRRAEVHGDGSLLRFVVTVAFGDARIAATLLGRLRGR